MKAESRELKAALQIHWKALRSFSFQLFALCFPSRPTPGSADLCFLAAIPMDAVLTHLAAAGVAIEEGPVARTSALGPIRSVYLRDPDGNLLEIAVDDGPA